MDTATASNIDIEYRYHHSNYGRRGSRRDNDASWTLGLNNGLQGPWKDKWGSRCVKTRLEPR